MINHSATGEEANGNKLGLYFQSSIKQWYVECTHKKHFHEKNKKIFLNYPIIQN